MAVDEQIQDPGVSEHKMRKINSAGLALLMSFETLRLRAYDDATGHTLLANDKPIGTPTIGWGHTAGVKPGDVCTREQADQWLLEDTSLAAACVEQAVTVPLTDNQFAALVSFTYNVGCGAFSKSTLLTFLNSGNYAGVPAQLLRWNKFRGRESLGLTRRREAEVRLWSALNEVLR